MDPSLAYTSLYPMRVSVGQLNPLDRFDFGLVAYTVDQITTDGQQVTIEAHKVGEMTKIYIDTPSGLLLNIARPVPPSND